MTDEKSLGLAYFLVKWLIAEKRNVNFIHSRNPNLGASSLGLHFCWKFSFSRKSIVQVDGLGVFNWVRESSFELIRYYNVQFINSQSDLYSFNINYASGLN